MRRTLITACLAISLAATTQAVDFLGVELCEGSVDTAVVLPVGSPMTLESAEIGRHGGLLLLLTTEEGDIMDHIDDLMAFYTDSRGTGDSKKLQWSSNSITAYAQLIKKGYAALAVSTDQRCGSSGASPPDEPQTTPVAETTEPMEAPEPEIAVVGTAAAVTETTPVDHGEETAPSAASAVEPADESAKLAVVAEPEPPADFVLKGRLKHTAADGGWVDVMGVVVNNSGVAYTVASFDLSLYEGSGELICVDTLSVNQLRDGQERAFRTAIRCADYDAAAVASWKLQFAGAH